MQTLRMASVGAKAGPLAWRDPQPYIRPMRRQGGGFGVVMLLVVVAIVLWLTARAWKNLAPTAAEIRNPTASSHEAAKAGVPPSDNPPLRPSLRDMKQNTSAHTEGVEDALKQAN